MNAIELAEECQDGYPLAPDAIAAAKMLRRQHEAIVKLRIALHECTNDVYLPPILRKQVMDALKDTEEFQ